MRNGHVPVLTEGVLKSMFAMKAKTVIATAFVVCVLSVSAGALAAVNFREGEEGGGTQHTSATANFAGDKKTGGSTIAGVDPPWLLKEAVEALNLKTPSEYFDQDRLRTPPLANDKPPSAGHATGRLVRVSHRHGRGGQGRGACGYGGVAAPQGGTRSSGRRVRR